MEFVTRKVGHRVAEIKLGLAKTLHPGNLGARRDWGFAGDYVRAMWLILPQDQPDDLVVATGETYSVGRLCVVAFGHVGRNWKDHGVIDERFTRPAAVERLVGDPARAKAKLGWQPAVTFMGFADDGRCGSGRP
jgi:GDPmannose 4,6-dehydratase